MFYRVFLVLCFTVVAHGDDSQTIKYELRRGSYVSRFSSEESIRAELTGTFEIVLVPSNRSLSFGFSKIGFFAEQPNWSISGEGGMWMMLGATRSGFPALGWPYLSLDVDDELVSFAGYGVVAEPIIVDAVFPAIGFITSGGSPATNNLFTLSITATPIAEDRNRFFLRGDANEDGLKTVTDAVMILLWLFEDGSELGCLDAADANDDGVVGVADAVSLLKQLFGLTGVAFPNRFFPGRFCGIDPTADALSCEGHRWCIDNASQ